MQGGRLQRGAQQAGHDPLVPEPWYPMREEEGSGRFTPAQEEHQGD